MAQVISKKSGNWSDPSVWSSFPTAGDSVTIAHNVTLDIDATVAGLTVNEGVSLELQATSNRTLQSSKNIIVYGLLKSNPLSTTNHLVRFINVNESNFVGSGEVPLDSDVGLWVMNNGQINLQGEEKTAWTRATGAILKGATSLSVKEANTWKVGDKLFITPTDKASNSFDEVTITSVSGTSIGVTAVQTAHPITDQWTAEVGNLTRNVRIEGTSTGYSHVFIKSTKPSVVQFVQFKYMGPRKNIAGDTAKELVVGRYALHFHHCEDGTRGMEVEGCVGTQCNNHTFVPHASHGMMWCKNIAYNVLETPYWYDMGHATHNLTFEENLGALINFVSRAIQPEDQTPAFAAAGMILGMGDDNICINNVMCGVSGLERVDFGGAYNWEANNEGIWKFQNNLAHHCTDGIRTWQNTSRIHVIEDYSSYFCKNGIMHGAYANVYKYIGGRHYGSQIIVHAGSDNTSRVRFENITCVGGGNAVGMQIEGSPVQGMLPVLVRNCNFINCILQDIGGEEVHNVDVIQSTGTVKVTAPGEVARVQPVTGTPTKITSSGTTTIPIFAPTLWSTGDGLRGEYFNNPDFTSPAFTRVDTVLNFQEWSNGGIHHLITDGIMSVRWTGQIIPQFSETYTFRISCDTGGVGKMSINGRTIITANGSGTIALIAGQKYDIKIEFVSSRYAGINVTWSSPSLEKFSKGGEYIPQSQMFSGSVTPPVNIPPTVNAGADQTITLPASSVTLVGSGSDSDGVIAAYQWSKVSGTGGTIETPNSPSTKVSGLLEGTYIFRLTVVDDKLATATDDITVFVKAAPVNQPPSVSAGPDMNLKISVPLNGSASDVDGSIASILWEQVSGPAPATINNPSLLSTYVYNLVEGTYTFRLTVTDDKGSIASDVMIITASK